MKGFEWKGTRELFERKKRGTVENLIATCRTMKGGGGFKGKTKGSGLMGPNHLLTLRFFYAIPKRKKGTSNSERKPRGGEGKERGGIGEKGFLGAYSNRNSAQCGKNDQDRGRKFQKEEEKGVNFRTTR